MKSFSLLISLIRWFVLIHFITVPSILIFFLFHYSKVEIALFFSFRFFHYLSMFVFLFFSFSFFNTTISFFVIFETRAPGIIISEFYCFSVREELFFSTSTMVHTRWINHHSLNERFLRSLGENWWKKIPKIDAYI